MKNSKIYNPNKPTDTSNNLKKRNNKSNSNNNNNNNNNGSDEETEAQSGFPMPECTPMLSTSTAVHPNLRTSPPMKLTQV